MGRWIVGMAWGSLLLGTFFLSPLSDIFPVDLWLWLKRFLASRTPDALDHLRITADAATGIEPFNLIGVSLVMLGLVLLGVRYGRKKN